MKETCSGKKLKLNRRKRIEYQRNEKKTVIGKNKGGTG